jgi:hypothetical protein
MPPTELVFLLDARARKRYIDRQSTPFMRRTIA